MSIQSIKIRLAKQMWLALVAVIPCLLADQALAQVPNTRIQLPTIRVTQFNSSFSVPDGGSINLSRIPRGDSVSRGRRSLARTRPTPAVSAQTNASAHVLIMNEPEQKMLDNNRPRIIQSNFNLEQLNGSAPTQAQADFISDNINRR